MHAYFVKTVLSNRVEIHVRILTNTEIEILLNQKTIILGTQYAISQVRRFLRYQNVIPYPKIVKTNNFYSNYLIFHE